MGTPLKNDSELKNATYDITRGYGSNGVIIKAAASHTDEIISIAFNYCRKKGRVVLINDVGLNIKRNDIYKKELDFLISTSYGLGMYDENYEEKCIDYPIGYVRWTEKRNMEAYLGLIEAKKIRVRELISKIFNFYEAHNGYNEIRQNRDYLINPFKYSDNVKESKVIINTRYRSLDKGKLKIGLASL
ncbi:MAG: hypothetical protein NC917_04565 [Candidatus Omnitrophica bacterium]|nr:hypothetical protein [Candidatus Omnitrophota bacterium]